MSDTPSLDRDLYCLTCGYNLRGLAGDPVRCPECGNLNPIGDVEIPAPIIKAQLRRMETSPAACLAAILFGLPVHIFFWSLVAAGALEDQGVWGIVSCIGLAALAAVGLWLEGCRRFRDSCLRKPGWGTALLMYHVHGLAVLVSTIAGVPLFIVLMVRFADRYIAAFPSSEFVWILVGLVLGGPAVYFWVRWLYRLATARLIPLQREVAVTIARDRARRDLVREHRGLFR